MEQFIQKLKDQHPHQPEFLQAVTEVMDDVYPYVEKFHPEFFDLKILERLTSPERIIQFRVCWLNDSGGIEMNTGYRVQMNSAIGPYKGGLRFSPKVSLSVLKFLAFEQTLKNSLTGLPLGGGKGGSDFNPKNRSDREIMSFCQSFMTELSKHIGSNLDIPAGDIGVGEREIGFLFGQYKRIRNEFTGVLTGKGPAWGGSYIRPEATGYGLLYFVEQMLEDQQEAILEKVVTISGCGNVAQYSALKAIEMGAKVITLSNSEGTLYDPEGFTKDKVEFLVKNRAGGCRNYEPFLKQYPKATFLPNQKPWQFACDIALPCATENELNREDALSLVNQGCKFVAEGANMPCDAEAIKLFQEKKIAYGPGKAANAGGVAVSGLEMAQNRTGEYWSREKVDEKLKRIMRKIHATCMEFGKSEDGHINYLKGANIGGFVKVAKAMCAQGIV